MKQDENHLNQPEQEPADTNLPEEGSGNEHETDDHEDIEDQPEMETIGAKILRNRRSRGERMVSASFLLGLISIAGIIFILLTKDSGKEKGQPVAQPMVKSSGESFTGTRIAFVRADSVQNNYLMTIHFLDSIEKRFRSMEGDLMNRKKGYEKRVENYYRDVQSGLLRENAALQIKEKLENEGDEIARLEESYSNRINDLQLKLNIIYFDSLWNFLDRHKEQIGFDMVVGYQQGLTNIFFADAAMDITNQVIALMNSEYADRYPDRKNLKGKKK